MVTTEPPPIHYELQIADCRFNSDSPAHPGARNKEQGDPLAARARARARYRSRYTTQRTKNEEATPTGREEGAMGGRAVLTRAANARAGARHRRNRIGARDRYICGGAWHRHGDRNTRVATCPRQRQRQRSGTDDSVSNQRRHLFIDSVQNRRCQVGAMGGRAIPVNSTLKVES